MKSHHPRHHQQPDEEFTPWKATEGQGYLRRNSIRKQRLRLHQARCKRLESQPVRHEKLTA